MKYIPIGITSKRDLASMMQPSDFSNELYDGVQLRKDRKERPVVIMHSRRNTPMEWKVAYECSTIFFNTLEEAVAYCEKHGMALLKEDR